MARGCRSCCCCLSRATAVFTQTRREAGRDEMHDPATAASLCDLSFSMTHAPFFCFRCCFVRGGPLVLKLKPCSFLHFYLYFFVPLRQWFSRPFNFWGLRLASSPSSATVFNFICTLEFVYELLKCEIDFSVGKNIHKNNNNWQQLQPHPTFNGQKEKMVIKTGAFYININTLFEQL